MKRCAKCKEWKSASEFYHTKRNPDGLHYWCKFCMKDSNKTWHQNNKEKHREHVRIWKDNNPEKAREMAKKASRKFYQDHKELVIRQNKERSLRNPEKTSARKKACLQAWSKLNPERINQYCRDRRARSKNAEGRVSYKDWISLCEKYGNRCLSCERNDVKMTQDHVIPLKLGGSNTIDNIQPLCKSCNSKKHTKIIDYRIGR